MTVKQSTLEIQELLKSWGKGKVLLKLTWGKTLALIDVLHAPTMHANLISIALVNKSGAKASFKCDKIILIKNNAFVGKDYCNQGLFLINVCNVVNSKASSSAYMIESISLWHPSLGHVNFSFKKNAITYIYILLGFK